MLISERYRSLCREMHERRQAFGGSGERFASKVGGLIVQWGCRSVLDYGAGKGTLRPHIRAAGAEVYEYDPAIRRLADGRREADLVACTDVLEHVEPECLDAVLDDLRGLARVGVYLAIGTGPADKRMPDGSNAHLIQQPMEWWLPKLDARWERVRAAALPRHEAPSKPSVDFEYVGLKR